MWKIGEIIKDQYEVLDIKQGGMGIVYIVKSCDESNLKSYAVKTLQDKFLGNTSWYEQFEQEAYTWIKLGSYEHIVRAIFVDRIRSQPYVFSEAILTKRVPNNLRGWISRDLLNLPICVLFALQFCMGMEYANLKGLKGHFDIKPENVMITDEGVVKITDWGLSRVVTKIIEASQNVLSSSPYRSVIPREDPSRGGTLPYMAPEIFSNADLTFSVDIYAFGIMLYEMLTGQLPFMASTRSDFQEAHLRMTPPPLESINPAVPKVLSNIVKGCLEKNPQNRPRNFLTIKQELASIFREQTGQEFPIEVKKFPLRKDFDMRTVLSLHFLGRDDEAVALASKVLPEEYRSAIQMWDDNELGWSFAIPSELWEEEQTKLQQNPQDPERWASLANMYALVNEHDKAIEYYKRAIQLAPECADKWQSSIESIENQKRNIRVDKANSLIVQGDNLAKAGRHREALTNFNEAIQLNPDDPMAWYNAGVSQMYLGEAKNALESFDKAISLDPDLVQAWSNRGALLAQQGKIEKALQSLERACQINPDHAKAWLNKGGIFMSVGRLHEALECFDRALEIDPDYRKAQEARQVCLSKMNLDSDPIQPAIEAFQLANSFGVMRRIVAQFPFMKDPDFITAMEQAIAKQVPPEYQPSFEQRLIWLRQIAREQ